MCVWKKGINEKLLIPFFYSRLRTIKVTAIAKLNGNAHENKEISKLW